MQFGTIDGLVDGQWQVVEDSGVLSGTATSYTFSSLDGDTDKKYMLIARIVGDNSVNAIDLTFNSDTGSNYGYQYIRGQNTTASASRSTSSTSAFEFGRVGSSLPDGFSYGIINAESGHERTIEHLSVRETNSTTVGAVQKTSYVWSNTADNLTSITLTADQTNGIGVGSHFILLKLVDASDGMRYGDMTVNGSIEGAWERVYDNTLGSAAASDTWSGADGDNDVIYLINQYRIPGSTSRTEYKLNADTGTNYGVQYLRGQSSTVNADRGTDNGLLVSQSNHTTSQICLSSMLLYAKSGYERVGLVKSATRITGTTITDTLLHGVCWSNTADNITSIVNEATAANGLGVDTYWEIYRLNL